ncbi:hypothetical protein CRENBAI_010031, partial [Crenichthys baileyi]
YLPGFCLLTVTLCLTPGSFSPVLDLIITSDRGFPFPASLTHCDVTLELKISILALPRIFRRGS